MAGTPQCWSNFMSSSTYRLMAIHRSLDDSIRKEMRPLPFPRRALTTPLDRLHLVRVRVRKSGAS